MTVRLPYVVWHYINRRAEESNRKALTPPLFTPTLSEIDQVPDPKPFCRLVVPDHRQYPGDSIQCLSFNFPRLHRLPHFQPHRLSKLCSNIHLAIFSTRKFDIHNFLDFVSTSTGPLAELALRLTTRNILTISSKSWC